jgi:hypothetical protein
MAPGRAATLGEAATVAGSRWAKTQRESLHAEGRRAVGGWPGTMSEARNYARGAALRAGLSHDELAWMARMVYDSARRDWLATRDPSDE